MNKLGMPWPETNFWNTAVIGDRWFRERSEDDTHENYDYEMQCVDDEYLEASKVLCRGQ